MVYLDYNASTPVDPRVADVVNETLRSAFGNPSSVHHRSGRIAHEILEQARTSLGQLLRVPTQSIIWTSGATEALTLALVGAATGRASRPDIVVSATEHKSVLAAAQLAGRLTGGQVHVVPVHHNGVIDLDALQGHVTHRTAVVAVMAANNETGVINPCNAVSEICAQKDALYLCDATQAVGKMPIGVEDLGANLLTLSGHKMYGPKGVGALVADRTIQSLLSPLVPGGGQERNLRGGTQNTSGVAGLGMAAGIAEREMAVEGVRLQRGSDRLLSRLTAGLDGVHLNGENAPRLPNTLNIHFEGADSEQLMFFMPDVEVSAGSACESAMPTPSHVLTAMGIDATRASQSIRISIGKQSTEAELDFAAERIVAAVQLARRAK